MNKWNCELDAFSRTVAGYVADLMHNVSLQLPSTPFSHFSFEIPPSHYLFGFILPMLWWLTVTLTRSSMLSFYLVKVAFSDIVLRS